MNLDYQVLKPMGMTGPIDVTARIIGYKQNVLQELGLESQLLLADETGEEGKENHLVDTVDLILVDDVSIDPGWRSIFNHRDNKVSFLSYFNFS